MERLAAEVLGNCYSHFAQKASNSSLSVHAAHLLWFRMASAPADQYHNKVTLRHYLLLLTERDSGHYQLP